MQRFNSEHPNLSSYEDEFKQRKSKNPIQRENLVDKAIPGYYEGHEGDLKRNQYPHDDASHGPLNCESQLQQQREALSSQSNYHVEKDRAEYYQAEENLQRREYKDHLDEVQCDFPQYENRSKQKGVEVRLTQDNNHVYNGKADYNQNYEKKVEQGFNYSGYIDESHQSSLQRENQQQQEAVYTVKDNVHVNTGDYRRS